MEIETRQEKGAELKQDEDIKNRLIKKMLEKLNAEPDRVMFPKGDAR